jgi:hypothetical protein
MRGTGSPVTDEDGNKEGREECGAAAVCGNKASLYAPGDFPWKVQSPADLLLSPLFCHVDTNPRTPRASFFF